MSLVFVIKYFYLHFVTVFFYIIILFLAVKCNDSLTVLEVLASLGVGFDCASKVSFLNIDILFLKHDSIYVINL